MNKSESIKELAAALAKAQADMKPAAENSTNPFFKSKYADLVSVWNAARPVLSANGLSVAQLVTEAGDGRIGLTTILMHTSGEWLESSASIPLAQDTPQAAGSALTYLRRYALAAMVGVVADEDDDGNTASQKRQQARNDDAGRSNIGNGAISPNALGRWAALVKEAKAAGVELEFGITESDTLETITDRAAIIKAAMKDKEKAQRSRDKAAVYPE